VVDCEVRTFFLHGFIGFEMEYVCNCLLFGFVSVMFFIHVFGGSMASRKQFAQSAFSER
jgi:hypothetical protein